MVWLAFLYASKKVSTVCAEDCQIPEIIFLPAFSTLGEFWAAQNMTVHKDA